MANLNNFWPKYVIPAFDNPALFRPVSDIRARTVHPSVKCTISLESGCLLPYHVDNSGSRPIAQVKQRRPWLVLR